MESETRQRIIALLYSAPQGPTEIASMLGLSQPYISNHLAALKSHRLVKSHREGRKSVYELEDKARAAMMAALAGFSEESRGLNAGHRGPRKTELHRS
ncbi:metalloregulator ArsR/SmtB family transcription factor [Arthrobacter sp. OAP107]|uniref:ArsR/SmtB family transcription factor n=1 Tax=Arthrobacter sp. OAP107 TaxID=3156445 RepID=UPI00339345E7